MVPIIKKLMRMPGRPSVLSRSSMYGRPMKRPCHCQGRLHSTDNEYDSYLCKREDYKRTNVNDQSLATMVGVTTKRNGYRLLLKIKRYMQCKPENLMMFFVFR